MKENEPSMTALSVIKHLLMLAEDKKWKDLVPKEAIDPMRWCLGSTPLGAKALQWMKSRWLRAYMRAAERVILPGTSLHLGLRKQWFERRTVEAIQNGMKRVVILGAGYDTLAYRMHTEHPDIEWIEIDHPATQQLKKEAFMKHGTIHSNLSFKSIDFTKDRLLPFLKELEEKPTIFIAEGLLMYLSEEQINELLDQISKSSNQELILLGTAMRPLKGGKLAFAESSWLNPNRFHEPFLWGIGSEQIGQFFKQHHWLETETNDTRDQLLLSYPQKKKARLLNGEFLFFTKRKAVINPTETDSGVSDDSLLQTN
ncbi:methyltransferase, TIGR00027 family [Seinonella peptonophila]|uniref:S-adenosyl-L-methionine-dependent methyltransferase n=1 Tax=Seinonella peptonophila TaxID=112248 RepID=A0A1M4WF09_9BACL|nr:class I SAM-dependent methyltransferase [Seinonella peptonophila]SHE79653.1 methyltransferase, TIGR00027 family [Seinonella peptonophila]